MNTLCIIFEQETNYGETIFISIVSSAIFAFISFVLILLYDYLKFSNHEATYIRMYDRDNPNLTGQKLAVAVVKYKSKGELTVTVTTHINIDSSSDSSKDYIFQEENIQEWKGIITMENKEAGKLYFYYLRPKQAKDGLISEFKRVLFLHNSQYLKLFGDGENYGSETFQRFKS